MKICFWGDERICNINRLGGIGSILKLLCFFLLRQGHKVYLFQVTQNDRVIKHEEKLNDGSIFIYSGSKKDLQSCFLKCSLDAVIFCQTPFENPLFALRFYQKKQQEKFISAKFVFTYPPHLGNPVVEWIKYHFLVSQTIVFSYRLKEALKKYTRQCTFLLPPVSESCFRLAEKRKSSSKVRIAFIGRLSRDKGLDIVLDVFRNLDRSRFACSICGYFASEADCDKYFQSLGTLNLQELTIVPHDSQPDQNSLPLHQYDVLLLPYQTMKPTLDIPLLILEGLAAGCHVVTSSIGAIQGLRENICKIKDFENSAAFIEMIDHIQKKQHFSKSALFGLDYTGARFVELIER